VTGSVSSPGFRGQTPPVAGPDPFPRELAVGMKGSGPACGTLQGKQAKLGAASDPVLSVKGGSGLWVGGV